MGQHLRGLALVSVHADHPYATGKDLLVAVDERLAAYRRDPDVVALDSARFAAPPPEAPVARTSKNPAN